MIQFHYFESGTWGAESAGVICEISGDASIPDPGLKCKAEHILGNLFEVKFKIISAIEFAFGIKVNITITGIEMLDKSKPEFYTVVYTVDGTDDNISRLADFINDRLIYLNVEFR
jgi:hypothetical protein